MIPKGPRGSKDVSYYCSWIKPRFDRYFAIKIGNREPIEVFAEPIKSWVQVGDDNYLSNPEWQELRSYIFEKVALSRKLPTRPPEQSVPLTDEEWAEKVRKECEDILEERG